MIIHTRYFCKTCSKWISAVNKDQHIKSHRRQRRIAKEKAGKPEAPKTDRGRLARKAKTELQFILECAYCKRRGTHDRGPDGLFWNMDHIIPWSVAEIESLDNYVKACHTCNLAKKNRMKFPTGDTMTAAHLTFRSTNIYRYLIKIGENPNQIWGGAPHNGITVQITETPVRDLAKTRPSLQEQQADRVQRMREALASKDQRVIMAFLEQDDKLDLDPVTP